MKKYIVPKLRTVLLMFGVISTILTGSVTAEVSRVVYFPIQSNTLCGDIDAGHRYLTAFYFNINNISDVSTDATLYLYRKDGTAFTNQGNGGSGLASEIVPGTRITIPANSTVQYATSFGYGGSYSCDLRPAYGKIVVNSNHGSLLAVGQFDGRKAMTTTTPNYWEVYQSSTININEGKPF